LAKLKDKMDDIYTIENCNKQINHLVVDDALKYKFKNLLKQVKDNLDYFTPEIIEKMKNNLKNNKINNKSY